MAPYVKYSGHLVGRTINVGGIDFSCQRGGPYLVPLVLAATFEAAVPEVARGLASGSVVREEIDYDDGSNYTREDYDFDRVAFAEATYDPEPVEDYVGDIIPAVDYVGDIIPEPEPEAPAKKPRNHHKLSEK